jgi:MOSC domain-containing protein YiiM
MRHQTLSELESRLDDVRRSPKDSGTLELIVRRPGPAQREVLEQGMLDMVEGLVGDRWLESTRGATGKRADPDRQLTVMSSRAAALFAGARERWALCGDQLYIDLDVSYANLRPGTRLAVGEAVVEVTPPPHTGCAKFVRRFGVDAQKLTKSPAGRELNLRGINARVLTPGPVRCGDTVTKLS